MVSPGKYNAKATAIRFVKPKDNIGIEVKFQFSTQEGLASMNWVGWITEKAMPNTLRTLVNVLEYNGDEETVSVPENDPRFGLLKNQDCINRNKEVQLAIDHEPNQEGKMFARIKWVNELGGGQFAGASPEIVKNDLNAVGFKAAFLAMKQGKQTEPSPAAKAFQAQMPLETDVPF